MIYTLCISEPHYRSGMFRIERFTDLKLMERARSEAMRDPRVRCWVQ